MTDTAATEWVPLCTADAVEAGTHKAIILGDRRFCVVNHGGTHYVVDDQCTHGPAFLSDGYVDTEDGIVECPLHSGQFSYCDGSAQGAPATRPVRSYPVRRVGDAVMIAL